MAAAPRVSSFSELVPSPSVPLSSAPVPTLRLRVLWCAVCHCGMSGLTWAGEPAFALLEGSAEETLRCVLSPI